ncbi:MAG TPA: peptidase S16 [Gammaproteobacteria bacterium]|nr:peptidase S16 [Gammaproteobacteria bacterium]
MSEKKEIALFPLRVVAFPGSRVDLQIFERRYIDLVTQSMKSDTGFGICLLKQGDSMADSETKQAIHRTGTCVKIADWDQLESGLLGITVEGINKFVIEDCWQADSGLLHATVEFSATDAVGSQEIPLQDKYSGLVDLLESLEKHPLVEQKNLIIDYDNLWDLGWRLSDLMPLDLEQKQDLLELDDPWQRIEKIEEIVSRLANEV